MHHFTIAKKSVSEQMFHTIIWENLPLTHRIHFVNKQEGKLLLI